MRPPAVRSSPNIRHRAHRWFALTLAAILLAGLLLRTFRPEIWAFYPACPFHGWTGLLCPGCGATRALAALAHGEFAQAMRSNALVIVALAACAAYLSHVYLRALRDRQPVWPPLPSPTIIAALASALIFAILRNLA